MMTGECPHCEQVVMRSLPDAPLPAMSHESCPECGGEVWVYYSRVDPAVYTPEGFAEHFTVNHETKEVTRKCA